MLLNSAMDYQPEILVVDDQESAREALKGLLMLENYRLVFAENGPQALEIAAQKTPDLILLDVMMPGMDGFEVCSKLRTYTQLVDVPIIMITSLDDLDSRLQGLEAGADDFISKPFSRAELRARVRTITRLNYQRRRNTQELQAERDRTKAILEAVGEAVIVAKASGQIEYVNPAACSLSGYTAQELIDQDWQLTYKFEDQPELSDEVLQLVQTGRTWRGEVTGKCKTDSQYDAALTVAPLFPIGQAGAPIGFVTVQRDITPLKQAERSKNEFVSNVSHELRTPLSVITLLSDNLETLYNRLPDQKRLKMIRDIQKHTQVLNDLIGDVLEISRIDSGRVSMERTRIEFGHLVREQTRELAPLVQQKMQHLQLSGQQKLTVWGNPAQLKQIVRNLINNAIKYTPDGGQIICEYRAMSIRPNLPSPQPDSEAWPGVDHLSAGEWAACRVSDSGIGISAEHLPHLFERFYRVKTEQSVRGTGLGLSIARELTELHNGHISVVSRPGQGSTFAIYLPLAPR